MGCRLCLEVDAPVDIFGKNEDKIQQHIWNCCQLQVERNDGLPDKICSLCATKLNTFLLFQIVSRQTDKFLRTQLAKNAPIKIEDKIFDYQLIPKSEEGTSSTVDDLKSTKFSIFEELPMNGDYLFGEPQIELNEYVDIGTKGHFDELNLTSGKHIKSSKKRVRSKTLPASKLKHNCGTCSKSFTTSRSLKDHTLIHLNVRNFQCTVCDKTFRRKNDLAIHQSQHSNEKYKCTMCSKVLCNSISLKNHALTHSETKNYACEICGRKFRLAKQFKTHMNVTHLKLKPYQCDFCGKLFATREHCRKHAEIHSEIPKYECDYCGKKVNFKHSLLSHFRTHTGERPFKCEYCLKAFALKKTLNSHILQHTGENPFKCEICFKGFKQKCNLKSHMRYNHKQL